jgi:hypothetical protein
MLPKSPVPAPRKRGRPPKLKKNKDGTKIATPALILKKKRSRPVAAGTSSASSEAMSGNDLDAGTSQARGVRGVAVDDTVTSFPASTGTDSDQPVATDEMLSRSRGVEAVSRDGVAGAKNTASSIGGVVTDADSAEVDNSGKGGQLRKSNSKVPSELNSSLSWSLRNKKVVEKGITSPTYEMNSMLGTSAAKVAPGSSVAPKKRGRRRKIKVLGSAGARDSIPPTTPGKGSGSTEVPLSKQPVKRKRGRPPKLRTIATNEAEDPRERTADLRAPKPIGSYYTITRSPKSGDTVVKKLSQLRTSQKVDEVGDTSSGTENAGVCEADDLSPPAGKKRAMPRDVQGPSKSPPTKDRPVKEKSEVLSSSKPVEDLVDGTELAACVEGEAVSLVVETTGDGNTLAGEKEATSDPSKQSTSGTAPDVKSSSTPAHPGIDPAEEATQQAGPKSPPPKPVGKTVAPGRAGRPTKISAVPAEIQKQPKGASQEPKDAQSAPPRGGVRSEGVGETEGQLAASPGTSESTSSSSLAGVGSEGSTSPSMLRKRGSDHATRHPLDRDSPEIPLHCVDTSVAKKQMTPSKAKKRKTLESVLTTLQSKLGKSEEDISPDGGSEGISLATGHLDAGHGEIGPSGAAAHPDKERGQKKTGPVRKRKTLVGKRAREKAEAFKLSVVDEEVSNVSKCLWLWVCQKLTCGLVAKWYLW